MRCGWPKPVRARRFRTLHAEAGDLFTLRRCALLSAILVLIAAARIVSTYTVLSHTVDEPIHLGAGMEWLDHGTMTGDVSHPPMARALAAPLLVPTTGVRPPGGADPIRGGGGMEGRPPGTRGGDVPPPPMARALAA